MPKPLISFDAAGTLIQVREPVAVTYAQFALQHGVIVEKAALKTAFRTLWGQIPPPLWPEGKVSPDDDRTWWLHLASEVFASALGAPVEPAIIDELFDDLYRHYANAEAWIVYDDVIPALDDLARDHQLCILSNFDRRLLTILEGHGLRPYFPHVILSSEVGAAKPHERMFNTALRLHEVAAEDSWHVGDDTRCDIEGATQNGWNAFHVTRNGSGLADLVKKVRF